MYKVILFTGREKKNVINFFMSLFENFLTAWSFKPKIIPKWKI